MRHLPASVQRTCTCSLLQLMGAHQWRLLGVRCRRAEEVRLEVRSNLLGGEPRRQPLQQRQPRVEPGTSTICQCACRPLLT